jgi:ABC-type multidrug transport system ATPase subunit
MKTETTPQDRQPRGESSAVVLQVDGLCFAYPQRKLFSGWSARIPPGVTLVRGGDGVGKTTLLRLLAGVLPAQGGALCVHGTWLAGQPSLYRQQVFWVDPRTDAHDPLTPADWFRSLPALYPSFDEARLYALVDGFGLSPHIDKPLYMLSTGSRRKVWLAAGFASGAALTLLDEPFAALDKASAGFVLELLDEAARHPSRAWLVAHYEPLGDVPLAALIDLGD